MPVMPNEEQKIQELRAALLELEVDWNREYRLVDNGETWQLQWLRPTTQEQFDRGNELVNSIMNS